MSEIDNSTFVIWIHGPKCFQTVHSPLFFREIFLIYRVLPLMAAILIFKCTKGGGGGGGRRGLYM